MKAGASAIPREAESDQVVRQDRRTISREKVRGLKKKGQLKRRERGKRTKWSN